MGLEQQLSAVCRTFALATVYAFGSREREIAARIRGQVVPVSPPAADADIAVQGQPGLRLSAADRVRLATTLEDLLGVARVDLVILSEADPFVAANAVRGELLYCTDPDAQAEEELSFLRRAGDLAPFERERIRLVLTSRSQK